MTDKEKQRIVNNEIFLLKTILKEKGIYLNITIKNLAKVVFKYVK